MSRALAWRGTRVRWTHPATSHSASMSPDCQPCPALFGAWSRWLQDACQSVESPVSGTDDARAVGGDADRLELAFDAQTSGGLLIAVPSARAEELVQRAHPAAGATASTVIGEVVELRRGVSVMLRP